VYGNIGQLRFDFGNRTRIKKKVFALPVKGSAIRSANSKEEEPDARIGI
jgi:hypothetical protein